MILTAREETAVAREDTTTTRDETATAHEATTAARDETTPAREETTAAREETTTPNLTAQGNYYCAIPKRYIELLLSTINCDSIINRRKYNLFKTTMRLIT